MKTNPHFAFANELFYIRDRLAHGKPVCIEGPIFDSYEEVNAYTLKRRIEQPDWYQKLTNEWMLASEQKLAGLMNFIGEARGHRKRIRSAK